MNPPSLPVDIAKTDARKNRVQTWTAVAAIVGLCLVAFWRLTLMKGLVITDDIFASDMMNENFPYRFAIGDALKSGHLPLWVREIYGGFPLLARSEAGVCYPLNLILFGLFSPYVAINLTILLTLATAGVGMYFHTREIGATFTAGLIGGVAGSFSGFLICHLKHLSIANGACWLPLALALLERAINRNSHRPLLWFGIVFAMQHLAGNAQVAYYCGLLYMLYFAFRCLNHQKASQVASKKKTDGLGVLKNRLTWAFAGILVLSTLLAAVQLIPTYELVSFSQRFGGVTFDYASSYAYDPRNIWTFFSPYVNGDIGNLTYTGSSIFWEDYGYVGVLTILLAISAPLTWWRNWHVRFFSLTAVMSYVLVLGPATPVYKIVFSCLPGMKYFRFPTRLMLVTDISIITLAALAVTRISFLLGAGMAKSKPHATPRPGRCILLQVSLLLAITSDLLYFQLRQNPIADATEWKRDPQTVQILKQDSSLFRLYCVGGNHAHKRMFESAGGWEGDLGPFAEQREFIQPSSNVLYGIASPNGYANLTPNYLVDVWGDQNRAGIITQTASIQDDTFRPTPTFWKLMRMYNVKYLTSFWPFASAPGLAPLGMYGGAYLYRNVDVLPRAYLVGQVRPVSDGALALAAIHSEAFAPEQSVLMEALPPNYQQRLQSSGNVQFLHYSTDDAEMRVQTPQEQVLVFSDTYYPGWVATVDGVATAIYRANITQRAVVVPSGEHHVRFHFQPKTVTVGFWISVSSLAVFLGFFLTPWVCKNRGNGKGIFAVKTAQDLPG